MSIYWLVFGILISFYLCVYRPAVRRKNEQLFFEKMFVTDLLKDLSDSIEKFEIEHRLMVGDKQPTSEDIEKYYKMYLIKFKLDQEAEKNVWTVEEPMTFDEWKEKIAEYIGRGGNGYRFLIANTSDVMVGLPPNAVYQRYRDYEKLIPEYEEMMKEDK